MSNAPATPAALREQLIQAKWRNSFVRVTLRFRDDAFDGYVDAVGPEIVLLALVGDTIRFDGFAALRIADLIACAEHPNAAFHEAALRLRGLTRPDPAGLSVDSLEALIRSAAARFPLLAVHPQRVDPDVCYIGALVRVGGGVVTLHEVWPDAAWDDELTDVRLDALSRVGFGGDYEDALHLVAGSPPPLEDDS